MHPNAQWDLDSYLKNNNKKSCLLPVQIKMVAANREQIKKKLGILSLNWLLNIKKINVT